MILAIRQGRALAFEQADAAFGFQAALAAGSGGARGFARLPGALLLFQPSGKTLESRLAIGCLRTPLCGRHADAAGPVDEPHACLDLVAVLTARPAGNEELHVAIAF